jgi:hypothetical protein
VFSSRDALVSAGDLSGRTLRYASARTNLDQEMMMKLTTALAATLALGLLAAAPAAAQDRHDPNGPRDRHDEGMRGDRHDMDRHDMDRDRHDRGRHEGWRDHRNNGHHYGWRNHRHCTWVWRHHRRMRVC